MKPKPKILIYVRDGLVQGTVANMDIEVAVADYDCEGEFVEGTDTPLEVNVYNENPKVVEDITESIDVSDEEGKQLYDQLIEIEF